jgi:hypothetical protein
MLLTTTIFITENPVTWRYKILTEEGGHQVLESRARGFNNKKLMMTTLAYDIINLQNLWDQYTTIQ